MTFANITPRQRRRASDRHDPDLPDPNLPDPPPPGQPYEDPQPDVYPDPIPDPDPQPTRDPDLPRPGDVVPPVRSVRRGQAHGPKPGGLA